MSNVSRWDLTEWPTWRLVTAITVASIVSYATKIALLWPLFN